MNKVKSAIVLSILLSTASYGGMLEDSGSFNSVTNPYVDAIFDINRFTGGKAAQQKEQACRFQEGKCVQVERKTTVVNCTNNGEPDQRGYSGLSEYVARSDGYETFVLESHCLEKKPVVISKDGIRIIGTGKGKSIISENGKAVIKIVAAKDIALDNLILKNGEYGLDIDNYSKVITRNLAIVNSKSFAIKLGEDGRENSSGQLSRKTIENTGKRVSKVLNGLIENINQLAISAFGIIGESLLPSALADITCSLKDGSKNTETVDGSVLTLCGETNLENNVSGLIINGESELNIDKSVRVVGAGSGVGVNLISGSVNVNGNSELFEEGHSINRGIYIEKEGSTVACLGGNNPGTIDVKSLLEIPEDEKIENYFLNCEM